MTGRLCISHLKGQRLEIDIFWRSTNSFNQYFLCMHWRFSWSFKSFSLPYTNNNFSFSSLKLINYFENAYQNPLQNNLLCSLVPTTHYHKLCHNHTPPATLRSHYYHYTLRNQIWPEANISDFLSTSTGKDRHGAYIHTLWTLPSASYTPVISVEKASALSVKQC